MKVLFLVPALNTPSALRGWLLAKALSKKHTVAVCGPTKSREFSFPIPSLPAVKKIPLNEKSFLGKVFAAKKAGQAFDCIVVSEPSPYACLAAILLKLKGKRIVFDTAEDIGSIFFEVSTYLQVNGIDSGLFEVLRRVAASKTAFAFRHFFDQLTVVSTFLQKKFGGVILLVPVDFADFDNVKRNPKKNTVLYFGGLQRHKGLDELLQAFLLVKKKIKTCRLILAGYKSGSPEYFKQLKQFCSKFPDYITIVENPPSSKLAFYHKSADCLVLPTPGNYIHRAQVPTKLFRYMASKTPIVATTVGDVPKLLYSGKCAFFAKPGDANSLANAIIECLTNTKKSKALAEQAYTHCKKHFSLDAYLPYMEKVLLGVNK